MESYASTLIQKTILYYEEIKPNLWAILITPQLNHQFVANTVKTSLKLAKQVWQVSELNTNQYSYTACQSAHALPPCIAIFNYIGILTYHRNIIKQFYKRIFFSLNKQYHLMKTIKLKTALQFVLVMWPVLTNQSQPKQTMVMWPTWEMKSDQ